MKDKILLVDDEINLLNSIKRQFYGRLNIDTSSSPQEALDFLHSTTNYSVIISDMKMPIMSGTEFLIKAKKTQPDAVRLMFSGQAEFSDTVDLINEAGVYQFLTKPCSAPELGKAILDAINKYHVQKAEKVLIEKTLHGCIKTLSEVIGLASPSAFARTNRVARLIKNISEEMKLLNKSKVQIAGLLAMIGTVAIPPHILDKYYKGIALSKSEKGIFARHPELAYKLLSNLPRISGIARIIKFQNLSYNELIAHPEVNVMEETFGANILKIAFEYDNLVFYRDVKSPQALNQLKNDVTLGIYQEDIFYATKAVIEKEGKFQSLFVKVEQMETGMILAQDVRIINGHLLVSKGQEITETMIRRLVNAKKTKPLTEPVEVYKPDKDEN